MSEDRTRMTTGAGRPVGDNQTSLTVDPVRRLFVVTRADIERYRENWQDEIDSASEYRSMAKSATDTRLAKVYANLAQMEETHIAFWEEKLHGAGASVGPRQPSWRSRVLSWIARRFGPDLVLATIAAREEADQNAYVKQPETSLSLR